MSRSTTHLEHPQEKRSINWGYLLVGILFLAVAVLAFINPVGSLEAIAFVFAFLAIINGIWWLAVNQGSPWRIIGGILDIVVGIFMLANIYYTMLALPYILAIWFIMDSVFRLMNIRATRLLGKGYFYMSLIFNILGIVIGILLLFNPITAVFTISYMVGFYLILAGIELIFLAFQR